MTAFESRVLGEGDGLMFSRRQTERSTTAVETSLWRCGYRHLQQAVVLALAGYAVAVLRAALDELHAYFVLLKLHQEPATQKTWATSQNIDGTEEISPFSVRLLLLIRDVNFKFLPVCGGRPDAMELGDDFNKVLTAEQEISFDS